MSQPIPLRLTHRQQMVLDFIKSSLAEKGYAPTLREIGDHMGIASTNGVNDHLVALVRKGHLTRAGDGIGQRRGKARAIAPVVVADKPRTALAQLRDIAGWVRKHPSDRLADALDHVIVMFMQRFPETVR